MLIKILKYVSALHHLLRLPSYNKRRGKDRNNLSVRRLTISIIEEG